MPTIGQDCHIILSHADIDAGAEYGFICPEDDSIREGGVQLVRQVISETTDLTISVSGTSLWCKFDLILADELLNPDGSRRTQTRAADYAKILQFLAMPTGLHVTTPAGTFLNMGSLGWSADERHKPGFSIIKCDLNNVGYYFPPADPELVLMSVWDGDLTWSTSYWR